METRGQVCAGPAGRGASGAAPRAPSWPCPGEQLAAPRPTLAALVPEGDPSGTGAAEGSSGLPRLVSDGERLSSGSTGGCTERLGLAQLRSVAQGDSQPQPGQDVSFETLRAWLRPSAALRGAGEDRKGLQRGTDVPLSEDEEEMERESPCSCRSTCEKGELSPALGQRPQPGRAKPPLGPTLGTRAGVSSVLVTTLTCHRSGQVTTGGPCTPAPTLHSLGPGSIPSHAQQQQQLPQRCQGQAGTHRAAQSTVSLGALGQLGATTVLAQQGLHAVDDVPDAADETLPLRLEDELIVDLRVWRGQSAPSPARHTPPSPSPCSHHGGCNFLRVVPIQVELEGHHLVVVGLQLALHHSVVLVGDLWVAGLAQDNQDNPPGTCLSPAWPWWHSHW